MSVSLHRPFRSQPAGFSQSTVGWKAALVISALAAPLPTPLTSVFETRAIAQPPAEPEQDTETPGDSPDPDGAAVVARIDQEIEIRRREVESLVSAVVEKRQLPPAALESLRAEARQRLVGQQLIVLYLESRSQAASATDVNVYVDQLKNRLEAKNQTWAEFLDELGIDEDEYRRSVRWKLSWENYLNQTMTDKNVEQYFKTHRASFDGTQLDVSQILIKVEPGSATQLEEGRRLLQKLKVRIEEGELSFADAAKEFSQAESARDGGVLGKIERHGVMPEAFASAAFELQVGEISPPVETSLGLHLIQVDQVHPGELELKQVRPAVEAAIQRYLFDWIVQRTSQQHDVELFDESR